MKQKESSKLNESRRDFIKKSSAGIIGLSLFCNIPKSILAEVKKNAAKKSRVVLVKSSKVINNEGEVNFTLLEEMLEKGLTSFNNQKPSHELWSKYFTQKDIVGLKINTLGLSSIAKGPGVKHFSCITDAIIASASKASFKEQNFIIWDRSEEELISAGYTIQKELDKKRVIGCVESRGGDSSLFSDEIKVGDKSTRLTKILTESCTALINIPVLKDHGNAGFTGALKNHYGTINNAREFHSNNCTNPGIPEINALPQIRSKQKLIIADALLGVFNGGPRWNRNSMWPYGGILVSEDPVAIDTVLLGIINEKRKSEGLDLISENRTRHIQLSSELGLGTCDLANIDLVKIDLG